MIAYICDRCREPCRGSVARLTFAPAAGPARGFDVCDRCRREMFAWWCSAPTLPIEGGPIVVPAPEPDPASYVFRGRLDLN